MRAMTGGRGVRAGLVACAGAITFAIAASVGSAVSPAGNHSASHQYQYDKKVTICHRTGSKKRPFVPIRVSRRAVPAHLAHGDRLGPCSRSKFAVCHKSHRDKGHKHGKKGSGGKRN
jgi:hypothetical protein